MPRGRAQASVRTRAAYTQLYRTFASVDRAHERWLAGVGSNGARYAVLHALASSGRAMTPSEVSDETGRSPNAISPLLRALHDEGLIKRSPNSNDRRSHFLALTAAGRRMAQRLAREESAFIEAALGRRSSRDLSALEKSLLSIEERAGAIQRLR